MMKHNLNKNLIEELRLRISSNSELINSLSDILCLGKEAIYRRMRGEVQFSLEEASIVAYHMGFSLDTLSGISPLKRPFVFKIANFANPKEIDYKLITEFIDFLAYIKDDDDTEMGVSTKIIPDGLHLGYPFITRFYLFKWIYQYDNYFNLKRFEDVYGSDRVLEILNYMRYLLMHIKKSYYIFDKKVFENLVDDIRYFESIGLISEDDRMSLKKDLHKCINDIESLAKEGVNELGNKTDIYLSNLNFEAGFSYVKSQYYNLSTIRAFTMYDISSSDKISYENSLKWMHSLKRASLLISQSGEIERLKFFNRQREIVDIL